MQNFPVAKVIKPKQPVRIYAEVPTTQQIDVELQEFYSVPAWLVPKTAVCPMCSAAISSVELVIAGKAIDEPLFFHTACIYKYLE